MAKDPATLFYWNDWHSGTVTLSRFLKGCYMDILHAQFNSGHLHLDEIKTVLGSDFGQSWPILQKKFKQDPNGLFFNERLLTESVKRRSYTKSRRDNLQNDTETSPHMGAHMENRNEIENRRLKFLNELLEYKAEFSEKLILDFEQYWMEMNATKTKFRFEGEKYFDFRKRLNTFLRNDKSGKYSNIAAVSKIDAILASSTIQDQRIDAKYGKSNNS
jgi:hypothetical protein